MNPEAMVVVGYGQIIPQAIIDIPPRGIINVHASLLPKYRGAAPIQWAIANGETRTGVTTMRIDAGLDTGDMLLKWETEIGPEENALELGRTSGTRGRGAVWWRRCSASKPAPMKQDPQDSSQATLAPILKKEDGDDRLELAGGENLQSHPRISAVAGRLQLFSRPDISHLEIARRRERTRCGRARADDSARRSAF